MRSRCLLASVVLATAVALGGCINSGTTTVGPGATAPLLYRTAGSQPGPVSCSWERRLPDGTVIAQIVNSQGPQYVEIKATDGSFFTHFCQLWVAAAFVGPQATPGQPFGPGDYRVGTEIAPGTYTAPGSGGLPGPGCSWSRVKTFSHEPWDALPDTHGPGTQTVTILSTDYGFTSYNCGNWSPAS